MPDERHLDDAATQPVASERRADRPFAMGEPEARQLEGRIAIVTGGSSGVGRATCLALAGEGATVVVVGTSSQRVEDVRELLDRQHPRRPPHLGLSLDVRSEADMAAMAQRTLDAFGRVDILIASAGILRPVGTHPKPLARTPAEEWDQVIDINLKGAFLSNRAVIPAMTRQRQGDIINVSSVSGLKGRAHDAPYCASKFGLMGLSESLAEEVRNQGIRVQVAVLDAVDTPIWQQNAPIPAPAGALQPERVARLIISMLVLPADALLVSPVVAPFVAGP